MSDLRWLEHILRYPPSCLSELEYSVGQLEVDFAGVEGQGLVTRPEPASQRRGGVRNDITYLSAKFRWDMHHQDPRRPRDMQLQSFVLDVDTGHVTVARLLDQQFGSGRSVGTGEAMHVEYGTWFYLQSRPDASARLAWEHARPEWALDPIAPEARESFLTALIDRLICDTTIASLVAALEPQLAGAGAELHQQGGSIEIAFRPGLPLGLVVESFHWEMPVASSGDVHMSSWQVAPFSVTHEPPWRPVVGRWRIEAYLDGWPRGDNGTPLPEVGRIGPSPLLDLRTANNTIVGITVTAT